MSVIFFWNLRSINYHLVHVRASHQRIHQLGAYYEVALLCTNWQHEYSKKDPTNSSYYSLCLLHIDSGRLWIRIFQYYPVYTQVVVNKRLLCLLLISSPRIRPKYMLDNKSVNHLIYSFCGAHVLPAASSPHSPSTKTHQPSSPWPPCPAMATAKC